ncbi:flavin reductase family protein [Acidaminococcus massiliensis]|jgi:flavin reductase (DIM6/NTAB) family NADH-FMN oxidoreductase RutF|uniref:flavin reductase family protein n=1 Tax=Acidaminococcus massiliensis TaxID=1852375 RepID=UPI00266CA457|nr:flavin reductase family protein [Acidaminococcus massiliensis]
MKQDLGKILALYPTPAVLVGSLTEGRADWTMVAHVGIIAHDRLLVSMMKEHYGAQCIEKNGIFTISSVTADFLEKADYAGLHSGNDTDKSRLMAWHPGVTGAPVPEEAKLVIECRVVDNYPHPVFDNFIVTIEKVWAEDSILDAKGKIDYRVFKPVLFEFPTYQYLETGKILGHCRQLGKNLGKEGEKA